MKRSLGSDISDTNGYRILNDLGGTQPNPYKGLITATGPFSANGPETESPTTALLAERGKTHGDFTQNALASQQLKYTMREYAGFDALTPVQKEALDMIAMKISRIITGNAGIADHWDDIAGYARLASERLAT